MINRKSLIGENGRLLVLFFILILTLCFISMNTIYAKTTLRFVYSGTSEPEKAWTVNYRKDFEEKYPDITIEYMYIPWADQEKKVAVMAQAGDFPDIIQVQDVTTLSAMGILEPLNEYLDAPESTINRDLFYSAALDYSIIDDVIYSIPAHMTVYGLVVNVDMLDSVGYTLEDIKIWDDILELGEKITDPDNGIYAYGYAAGLPRFAWRDAFIAGVSNDLILSEFSPGNEEKYEELFNYYNELKPFIPPAAVTWSYPEMFRAFCQEQVAVIPVGSYFTSNVAPIDPNIVNKSRAIPYPQGPSSYENKALVANAGWAILKGSEHKEEAWMVIQDLLTKENDTKEAAVVGLPVRKDIDIDKFSDVAGENYPDIKDANTQIIKDFTYLAENYGVPLAKILRQNEMEVRFQEHMYNLLTDKITPSEFYPRIKKDIEEIKNQ